jgi:hypothetical protein
MVCMKSCMTRLWIVCRELVVLVVGGQLKAYHPDVWLRRWRPMAIASGGTRVDTTAWPWWYRQASATDFTLGYVVQSSYGNRERWPPSMERESRYHSLAMVVSTG